MDPVSQAERVAILGVVQPSPLAGPLVGVVFTLYCGVLKLLFLDLRNIEHVVILLSCIQRQFSNFPNQTFEGYLVKHIVWDLLVSDGIIFKH